MTSYTIHKCPRCGGPMPPPSVTRTQRCKYCAALLAPDTNGWRAAPAEAPEEPLLDPQLRRLWVGGFRYAVLGKLARGRECDVFRARRDARLTEHVLLKIPRSTDGVDSVKREQEILARLEQSEVQGASHFTRLLPQRVEHGVARLGMNGQEGECRVAVMRWRAGFVHTFDDVFGAYPNGVPAAHAVWMWKRVLESLGWIHRNGFIHGAVVPEHLLVHARDHGVVLVGWSAAMNARTPETDLAMTAQVIRRALAGGETPVPLARLLEAQANREAGAATDAWALKDQLDAVAREAFGPPHFVRFDMPGWH